MAIEPNHIESRLRDLLGLHGTVLTDEELSLTADGYARSQGKERWDVRQYVRRGGPGAREYRVVRGSSAQHVYRSADWDRAVAVGSALNELESREASVAAARPGQSVEGK